jgi:hypothetical protein
LLSLTLILSWNSFSQTATEVSKDTTHIVLSNEVARQVAADLLEGDALFQENNLLYEEIDHLKGVVAIQDSLRTFQNNQIVSLEKIIELKELQAQQYSVDYKNLNKEVRKQSTLKTVFMTTTAATAVALIVTLLIGGK